MKYLKRFESPDNAKYKVGKKKLLCKTSDGDSVAFTMDANDEHVLVDFEKGDSTHYIMRKHYRDRDLENPHSSSNCKCSGRVWLNRKFISFWVTPSDKDELQKCLKELNQELIHKGHIVEPIFNNGWYVENYNGYDSENKWAVENDLQSIKGSIPLELYTGGQELDKEKYILHTMTPEEKERYFKLHPELRVRGWGADLKAKKNPIWWEQAKRTSENKLYENPDHVKALDYKGNRYDLHYTSIDSFCFGYHHDTNKLLIGSKEENIDTHYDLHQNGRKAMYYPGRFWMDAQLISFWEYPEDYKTLKKIINDINNSLENEYGIGVALDDNWEIEIVVDESGNPDIPKTKYWGYRKDTYDATDETNIERDLKSKIIKVGDYTGSAKRSKEELRKPHAQFENKLYESPNMYKGYDWFHSNCMTFSYYLGDLYFADEYDTNHYGLFKDWSTELFKDDKQKYDKYINDILDYERKNGRGEMSGRLFLDPKVVTFWRFPKSKKEMKQFIKEVYYETEIDISKWEVEILVDEEKDMRQGFYWGTDARTKLIPIKDFTGSKERSEKEMAKKHVYESAQFTYNKQLNPKFWSDGLFSERIREKLLTIAYEFYNELGYETPISDIELTGSLANYNWNEYSDFDVHILIDFSKINSNVELVKKAVDGQRFMWNLRHNVSIKGHDVEMYIQDINEPHTASGLFSLKDNKWITVPKYNQPTIDEEEVNFKYLTYKSGVDKLEEISNREMSPESAAKNHLYASEMKTKIMKSRKVGLEKPEAEFSVENLVFKRMRNNGDFERLIDIIGKFYDKIYTQ